MTAREFSVEEWPCEAKFGLRVDAFAMALIAGEPPTGVGQDRLRRAVRREAFTVRLAGINTTIVTDPSLSRMTSFEIGTVQVDMHHPNYENENRVVLANVSDGKQLLDAKIWQDDTSMVDVHLRKMQVSLARLELTISEETINQGMALATELVPGAGGLEFVEVLNRIGRGHHDNVSDPPTANTKYVFSGLEVSSMELRVWCRIFLPGAKYLPSWLRTLIQISSFSWMGKNMLEVKGAKVAVPQQSLFLHPAEGSLNTLLLHIAKQYQPMMQKSWKSVIARSNVFFFGLLAPHTWKPKKQEVSAADKVLEPLCLIDPETKELDVSLGQHAGGSGQTAPMTEEGYQAVAVLKSDKEMKTFVRRVLAEQHRRLRQFHSGGLNRFVPFYSGTRGVQTLARMIEELKTVRWASDVRK